MINKILVVKISTKFMSVKPNIGLLDLYLMYLVKPLLSRCITSKQIQCWKSSWSSDFTEKVYIFISVCVL